MGKDIGSGLGRVLEVEYKAFAVDQAQFLRIQIELPLNKPLHRSGPIVSPEGDKALVAFKYERLDGLCFNCGILGLETKLCPQKNNGDGQKQYGEWLKAGNKQRGEPSSRKPTSTPLE